jgi:plasmid stability protein
MRAVQIRSVPDRVHRRLKSRAEASGMSLSEFLLKELERIAARPSPQEMLARLNSREPVVLSQPIVDIIAEGRRSR